jgi:hypothetical protein
MLEEISWKDYMMGIGLGAFAYYTVVLAIYYKNDLRSLLSGKFQMQAGKKGKVDRSEEGNKDPMEELEAAVADIRSILEKAGNKAAKSDILHGTAKILQNYPGFREPAYRVAIRNFIIQHADEICRVEFSVEELEEAWMQI